jgi:hypothetical protein
MGKTYHKNSRRFDDEVSQSGRSGKHAKHSNNRKSGGMRTLNSYAEDEYDDYDLNNDDFDDEVGIEDDIQIQHNENTK